MYRCDFLEDAELKNIILNSNRSVEYVNKCLRNTLYLLLYCNYDDSISITETEILLINNYKNKIDFNNLFKLIISDAFSIKDLCLFH